MSGWSVGKIIIIILSFQAGTSTNKNTDHGVKETYAIMSTQVNMWKRPHLFTRGSAMSGALNFCFLCISL